MTDPDITWALIAQKRAIRAPEGAVAPYKDSPLHDWVSDEEGFLNRWPDNKRPDMGTLRGKDYKALAARAFALNEAQTRSGFLDWLYVVDVDFPVHQCRNCYPADANPKENP